MDSPEFDASGETNRLQDAVRRHDRPLLEQLLSDRFAFVSDRALGAWTRKIGSQLVYELSGSDSGFRSRGSSRSATSRLWITTSNKR
jgi:hypothetical protein